MEERNKNNSPMPVASLTLGIISIVFAFFWYISLPCGIIAIVFGTKSIRRYASKLGKAGLITGIIGLATFTCIYISIIFIVIVSNM